MCTLVVTVVSVWLLGGLLVDLDSRKAYTKAVKS